MSLNKANMITKKAGLSVLDIPQDELNWSSVRLADIITRDNRLEASFYDIEGRHAREVISKAEWPIKQLCGNNGLATAYHRPRFKRVWVDKSTYPIYQPSQITEIHPKPSGYISEATHTDIDALRVKKGQVLLTCSGTIGKCSIVTRTLEDCIFSHDLIRINCIDELDIGYIYTFLKSKIGNTLINTNNYGAVIPHIEPEHLFNVPIPNPPNTLKNSINELILKSFALRDESNVLIDKAEELMIEELKLPHISKLKSGYYDDAVKANSYVVKLSELNTRLDSSYHAPVVNSILTHLNNNAIEVTTVGDNRFSDSITLPGRFKRVYVDEGRGVVFLGGKQINELDPTNKKYLSLTHHKTRIEKELRLKENMILITCSGTIGKVAMVPRHWEQWTMSQHVIRIIPASDAVAGYIYVFLSSAYGYELIKRFTYGSVVDEIDDNHVSQIQLPLIPTDVLSQINDLAVKANKMRFEAYLLERNALKTLNQDVLNI